MSGRNGWSPSVFVCGPITRALTGDHFDTRVRDLVLAVTGHLERAGIGVLSAHAEEQWGKSIPASAAEVLRRDWALARSADALVFVLPADAEGELYRTDGTFIELGWALALDKPLVLVTDLAARGRSYMFDGVLETATPGAIIEASDPDALGTLANRVRAIVDPSPSETRMPRVGFCSTTFGFGPVSKVTAVAEAVRQIRPRAHLVFAGSDLSLHYARSVDVFDELIDIDTDRDSAQAAQALAEVDAIVNSLNFEMLAAETSAPQHFVDSLAWLWPAVPAAIAQASTYFVQDYLLPPRRRGELPPHAHIVPPVVSPAFESRRSWWEVRPGHALVHLGGCRNPFLPADAYAGYVRNMVEGFTLALQDERLAGHVESATVCGNPSLLEAVGQPSDPRVQLQFLPRREFARELRRAELLLTSPGLTSTLESISLGVPCRFVLPHNFSQYRIDETYRTAGLGDIVWPDPISVPALDDPDLPEDEGVRLVAESLEARLSEGADRTAAGFVALLGASGVGLDDANRLRGRNGSRDIAVRVVDQIEAADAVASA